MTSNRAKRPGPSSPAALACSASRSSADADTAMRPAPSMASRALVARLSSTCSTWTGSARTGSGSAGTATSSRMSPRRSGRSRRSAERITVARSTGTGSMPRRRLKVRRPRATAAARSAAATISSTSGRCGLSAGSARRSADPYTLMTERMLLNSWATPPASCPTASSFWAWMSCSSSSRCRVRSTPEASSPGRPASSAAGVTNQARMRASPDRTGHRVLHGQHLPWLALPSSAETRSRAPGSTKLATHSRPSTSAASAPQHRLGLPVHQRHPQASSSRTKATPATSR